MTAINTVSRSELSDGDRELVTSYATAVAHHIATMTKVIREPKFGSGPSLSAQATSLSRWWEALSLLADRVTPGDAAATRYLDDQRVQWFRARQAALLVCLHYVEQQGVLGDPTIPTPEDTRTGIVGDGFGYVGYARIDERLACLAPVEVRLRVSTDGSVTLLRPDVKSSPEAMQLQRDS